MWLHFLSTKQFAKVALQMESTGPKMQNAALDLSKINKRELLKHSLKHSAVVIIH